MTSRVAWASSFSFFFPLFFFFKYEYYHVPVVSYFKSKRSTWKMSQNQFVFQTHPWGTVTGVVFDMHRDTYPLSIFPGREMEGEVLQESLLPPWDTMLLDFDHWHLLFHASRKTRPLLPLRNYSNDLQLCMFSYSFVVGIWEHILTSQLLMQGSE